MGTSAGPRRPVAQRGGSGSGGAVGRPPVSAGAQAVTDEGASVGGRRDRRPCPPETRRSPEGIRHAARRTLVSRGQKPSAPTDTRPPEAATHRARGPGRGSGRPTRQGFRGSVWGRTPLLGTDAGDGGTDGGRASCR